MQIATFTDVGIDPDRLADDRDPDWLFLEGSCCENDWAAGNTATCPVCEGEIYGYRYCLRCDSAGLDGRADYPGLPIGYAMIMDYDAEKDDPPATPTVHDPSRPGRIELPGGQVIIRTGSANPKRS